MTESSRWFDDDSSRIDPQGVSPERADGWPVDASEVAGGELDADAFQQCYLVYGSGVRAALRARLANDLDVEDCFNRVFEKLWSRGRSIPPASRRAWLFVVARNEAALLGRIATRAAGGKSAKNKSAKNKSGDAAGWQGKPAVVGSRAADLAVEDLECSRGDSTPLELLLKQEEIESLRRAVRSLTQEQVEVLRYRFFEDLPFREVAQRLSIPLGTALSRARAAIKRLRDELNCPADG